MRLFNRITIIGLGLIGGSLGLAIKEKRIAGEVVGVSRRSKTIRHALSSGIVDRATLNLRKGVADSELVILAVPVLKIIDIAREILDSPLTSKMSRGRSNSIFLKKCAILIDVGSTKRDIVQNIEKALPGNVDFIGSHPLAGSEKSGLEYADKDLFKGAYCILTRTRQSNPAAMAKVRRFWSELEMKVEIMSPEEHDKVVSMLSHLPHAVSVGLSNLCAGIDLHLAASGFRDTTRIASGDPELWKDIFVTNRKNIVHDIRILKKQLSKIEDALDNGKGSRLLRLFRKAKAVRDSV